MFEGATACLAKINDEVSECSSETTECSGEEVSDADVCIEENEVAVVVSEVEVDESQDEHVDHAEDGKANAELESCVHHAFMAKVTVERSIRCFKQIRKGVQRNYFTVER